MLHNREFGDDIRLEGYIARDLPSLLISQSDISGTPATAAEMTHQLRAMGYAPLDQVQLGRAGSLSFYQTERRIAFFDAHPGNFFTIGDVTLPVDGIILEIHHESEHLWLAERICY